MEVLIFYVRTSPVKVVLFSRMILRLKNPVLIPSNEANITLPKNVSM